MGVKKATRDPGLRRDLVEMKKRVYSNTIPPLTSLADALLRCSFGDLHLMTQTKPSVHSLHLSVFSPNDMQQIISDQLKVELELELFSN